MNELRATLHNNGHLNVVDANGITQTYLVTRQACMWRTYKGQGGVKAEPCTISEFYRRIVETFNEQYPGTT